MQCLIEETEIYEKVRVETLLIMIGKILILGLLLI